MTLRLAIGMMSGTSMDGIDIAAIRTDGRSIVERGVSMAFPFDPAFRHDLARGLADAASMTSRDQRPGDLAALEREITRRHGDALAAFMETQGMAAKDVAAVGFHGQTVLHRPDKGFTVQLGDGAQLARDCGMTVVWDMRANDMAHGGQGAPLVPAYHQAIVTGAGLAGPVMVVNIGGIANVTWIADGAAPVAFDCGPGNALIDQWVTAQAGIPYDDGGRIASEGAIDEPRLAGILARPFFSAPGPKSLDRNDFLPSIAAGLDLADGARTLAALTARAIHAAQDVVPTPPATWIICGGGRKNAMIVNDLSKLAESDSQTVLLAEEAGFDGDATEAEAWAYLAIRCLDGLPITYPTTTGCARPVSGGIISRPE